MFRHKALSCNVNWTLIETLIKTLIFWNKFSDHRVQFSGKPQAPQGATSVPSVFSVVKIFFLRKILSKGFHLYGYVGITDW